MLVRFCFTVAVYLLVQQFALAQTVFIPVPELEGTYSYSPEIVGDPNSFKRFALDIDSLPNGNYEIALEIVGTMTFGELIGDGIRREAVTRPIIGSFFISVTNPNSVGEFSSGPFSEGSLTKSSTFYPIVIDDGVSIPDNSPERYSSNINPLIGISFNHGLNLNAFDIPFLEPFPVDPVLGTYGLVTVRPMTGEITSARLIVNRIIPEPRIGGLIICLLAAMALVWRTRHYNNRCPTPSSL